MNMKFRKAAVLLLALTVLLLAGCHTQSEEQPPEVTSIAVTDPTGDLAYLDDYPALQSVDLRGYRDYDAIMAYIAAHPAVTVTYDVEIAGTVYPMDTAELKLTKGGFSCDQLLQNVKYLPDLTKIDLPETDLTAGQIAALREACPNAEITYSVLLNGTLLTPDTAELDLSWITPDAMEETVAQLQLITGLADVQLMDAEGNSKLSVTDVKYLQDSFPGVFFRYSFDLFGQTVSTEDETIVYDEVDIGNEGEAEIRQALDILTSCTYFKLDSCGIDNEIMDAIRNDYPDKKIVWRVFIRPFSMLTDETMLRLTFHLDDSKVENLKYLHDVTYMDIGHNEELTDISFVQYMPKLECVIVSGAPVVDISYFENCKELVWLELCFCTRVKDLSSLSELPNLKYLNVSYSKVSDLSPLDNLKLERLNCMNTSVDREQREAFEEKHPDCLSIFEGKQPYGYGWRYDDYGYTFFEYYANMRKVFRYDDKNYWGNHKE